MFFGVAPGRGLRLEPVPSWTEQVLERIRTPKTVDEIVADLAAGEDVDPSEVGTFLRSLLQAGVAEALVRAPGQDPPPLPERYQRLVTFWGLWLPGTIPETTGQQRLRSAHVAVLGCGGIGTHLALGLAATGIGTVTLIDHDVVEPSNLNRQVVYRPEDVGSPKVEVTARAIVAQNPEVQVRTVPRKVMNPEDLSDLLADTDILLQTADEPPVDLGMAVNAACLRARTPWIGSGTVEDLVEVGPLVIPGEPGCFRCWAEASRDEAAAALLSAAGERQRYGFPSFEPLFSIAAGVLLSEAVRYILGVRPLALTRRVLRLQLNDLSSWTVEVTPNPSCPDCGTASAGFAET